MRISGRLLASTLLAGCLCFTAADPAAAQEKEVVWRVKDRFRLFDRANFEARQRVQVLLDAIEQKPNAKIFDFYDLILATFSGLDGSRAHSASLRGSNYQPAPDEGPRTSGRYRADYLYPDAYWIELRTPAAPAEANCTYRAKGEAGTGPCGAWTPLLIRGRPTATAGSWITEGAVEVSMPGRVSQLDVAIQDQLIVALGDSYISGEGNPDVPAIITDRPDKVFERPSWGGRIEPNRHVLREAAWWDEPCHRSLLSWPVLASFLHAARNPEQAVTLVHLGCSGAVARDIYRHGETELPGGGDEKESQLALLDQLLVRPDDSWPRRKPDKVFLSIGGNDIGFGGVVTTLLLPTNGFTLGGPAARLIGNEAGGICPYGDSGKFLNRLCGNRKSAQARLAELRGEYDGLRAALKTAEIDFGSVYQTLYPNPLVDRDGKPCDTNPGNDEPRGSGDRTPGGEALMGVFPRLARGWRFSAWNFELMYLSDKPMLSAPLFPELQIACDRTPDPDDSEVCQTLWIITELNRAVAANASIPGGSGWNIVSDHTGRILKNGLCNNNKNGAPLALPLVANGRWIGASPQQWKPYDKDSDRWFRMPNDSLRTQFAFYNGKPRFHHGTAHPTFRSHVEIAQAAYDRAFGSGPGSQ